MLSFALYTAAVLFVGAAAGIAVQRMLGPANTCGAGFPPERSGVDAYRPVRLADDGEGGT